MSDQTIPTALGKRRSRLGQLEDKIGLPATFALTSATIGLISGLVTGGITAVMTNLVETPQARPHILRVTRIFGTLCLMVLCADEQPWRVWCTGWWEPVSSP